MPNYTPALVNPGKPKFSFKTLFLGNAAAKSHYFSARHKTDDIYILWIESNRLGRMHCFPCVLDEQGDPMVYFTGKKNMGDNRKMLQRWNLFVVPSSFAQDFDYTELEAGGFYSEYNDYKLRAIAKDQGAAESEASRDDSDAEISEDQEE